MKFEIKLAVVLAVALVLLLALIGLSSLIKEPAQAGCSVNSDCMPENPLAGLEYYCDNGICKTKIIAPPPIPGDDESELQFMSMQGECSSGSQNDVAISLDSNDIILSGLIGTPNPCYLLSAEKSVDQGSVQINIRTSSTSDMCIECIGEVSFSGRITGLNPGLMMLKWF